MERLTEIKDGYIKVKGCTTLYGDTERKGALLANAIVRLTKYEDMMERWGFSDIAEVERIFQMANAFGWKDEMVKYKRAMEKEDD